MSVLTNAYYTETDQPCKAAAPCGKVDTRCVARSWMYWSKEEMTDRCVACGSPSWSEGGAWKGYRLAVCGRCGLTFTLNPDYSTERYAAEYDGSARADGPAEKMHGLIYEASAGRLELEARAYLTPPPRLTPAQKAALDRLEVSAPPGAAVIDCGCGSGGFLRALHASGLEGVGVEVSPRLVELLRQSGMRAILGAAPDFPWSGEEPFAITFFEVLEHFPDPSRVIRVIKTRFPHARILASVPSPFRADLFLHGKRGLSDLPPNHFLRWTPRALESFFLRLGCSRVKVLLPAPIGSELMPGITQLLSRARIAGRSSFRRAAAPVMEGNAGSSAGRRVMMRLGMRQRTAATAVIWLQRAYQASMDVAGAPKALLARMRGASAGSMLVVAE